VEKIRGTEMPGLGLGWLFWIPSVVGLSLLITVITLVKQKPKVKEKPQEEPSTIPFYRTRGELAKARDKMETELKGAAKIWIATWTGKYFRSEDLFDKHHIDKLLLIDPTGYHAKSHIKVTGEDAEDLVNEVILTSRAAKKRNTTVRFADFPIMDSVIIVDKKRFENENDFTDDAWARVETAIPFRAPNNCPNFVVYKSKDPQLFQALVEHYRIIWNISTDEPTPQSETEVYSTSNKLMLVVKAITEAKKITPRAKDITVYISHTNRLASIYIQELYDILLKLQDDEKIIAIKSFPDWLLPSNGFTKKQLSQEIKATLDPSIKNFKVRILKKFDEFAKQ